MIDLPDWVEDYRIPDEMSAKAYDETPARLRAYIKAGIALAHFHFDSETSNTECRYENRHAGFWKGVKSMPAAWACLVFDGCQDAAAMICAVSVVPRLADVETVVAVCIAADVKPALLVTLELCGIEDIFTLNEERAVDLVLDLASHAQGRACILHHGTLLRMCENINAAGIQVMSLHDEFELLLLDPQKFDPSVLRFCLGRVPDSDYDRNNAWECIYAADPASVGIASRLKLGPGCEGFWLFEGLAPGFYRVEEMQFGESSRC